MVVWRTEMLLKSEKSLPASNARRMTPVHTLPCDVAQCSAQDQSRVHTSVEIVHGYDVRQISESLS